jgi:hypothetical protein
VSVSGVAGGGEGHAIAANLCLLPLTHHSFQHGLGMTLVAKSDHSTGNSRYASYVLRSHDLTLVFTAPYSRACAAAAPSSAEPLPGFDQQAAFDFIISHGLAVRAVGEVLSGWRGHRAGEGGCSRGRRARACQVCLHAAVPPATVAAEIRRPAG